MSGVMELASDILGKSGKPAYVEFSAVAKQIIKRDESGRVIDGPYQARDVDMVTVRQIGSADSSIFEVDRWLKQNAQEMQGGRLPREHAAFYERAYKAWKQGQELPVDGTPVKGWAMISPAQAETIIRAGVRTVEDLSTMNAEAMTRIGMGAVKIKHMAAAWIEQAHDKGGVATKMANLQTENDLLKLNLTSLTEQVQALQREMKVATPVPSQPVDTNVITADDLLGNDEPTQPLRKNSKR